MEKRERAVGPEFLSHVVLIKFHDTATEEQRREVYEQFQTLAENCGGHDAGILYFEVGHNLDTRKGWHLVEVAWFRDDAALQAFRVHPKHKELTDKLREIADWVVGDIMAEFPTI